MQKEQFIGIKKTTSIIDNPHEVQGNNQRIIYREYSDSLSVHFC
jgi:hypothetical protein